ncbi:MAG TPA: hypothetical protein VN661_02185 [Candidatus Acidoferrales bacterium]|nr:hypothetical protein [Candidatus Acidoferrales bacterium]
MSAPYVLRIAILCLASFFLVNAALGLLARILSPAAIRRAARMNVRAAEQMLFALRLLPPAAAAFAVLALCLPSYLWLEPTRRVESIGLGCSVIALLGLANWIWSAVRAIRALRWLDPAAALEPMNMPEISLGGRTLRVIDTQSPVLALAGFVRPRIILSSGVARSLSVEQLELALRHEDAHRRSGDNWKRLLLLAPDVIPFSRTFRKIEAAWAVFAEWAADDEAADNDPGRSVALAETLLRVARLGTPARLSPLFAPFVSGDENLAARVERLLRAQPAAPLPPAQPRARNFCLGACAALAVAALALLPAALPLVHEALERLIR